jgi:predicted small integral membrane protein
VVARLAKITCVAAVALYIALVSFGNVTDYWTNFAFVTNVLDMNDVQDGAAIRWRAATSPGLHQLAYLAIIVTETAVAALTWAGVFTMLRARKSSAQTFRRAKNWAIIGLALGFLLFEGGFIAIGGEWFGMWRAPSNADAVPSAFRIAVTMLGVLIYVSLEDGDAA